MQNQNNGGRNYSDGLRNDTSSYLSPNIYSNVLPRSEFDNKRSPFNQMQQRQLFTHQPTQQMQFTPQNNNIMGFQPQKQMQNFNHLSNEMQSYQQSLMGQSLGQPMEAQQYGSFSGHNQYKVQNQSKQNQSQYPVNSFESFGVPTHPIVQQVIPYQSSIFSQVQVRCTFFVRMPVAVDIQQSAVFLVGGVRQLGFWQPHQAIRLINTDRQGNLWLTTCELDVDSLIEYKYIQQVYNAGMGVISIVWEDLPSNRLLNTTNKQEIRVMEVWNNPEVQEDFVPLQNKIMVPQIEMPSPIINQIETKRHSSTVPSSLSPIQNQQHLDFSSRASSISQQFHLANRNQTPNRLASSSDASFINEETMGQWPVEQSMLVKNEQPTHDLNKITKQDTNHSSSHQQTTIQQVDQHPNAKMRKALENAFKDYLAKDQKDTEVWDEGTEEINENKSPTLVEKISESPNHQVQVEIDRQEPILHVCYMLPYRLTKDSRKPNEFVAVQCYHNPTFLYATLDYLCQQGTFNFYWVGIVSTPTKLSEAEETKAREVLKEKKCFPVFVTLKEIQAFLIYYETMVKPKMHNFVDLKEGCDSKLIQDNWGAYVNINQKIGQKVLEVRSQIPSLHRIWVHGDHLMLVPQQVRKSFQSVNLGYYFHSAFPASAVFKSLYYRRELLNSLLQSDLVSFHLFEYARCFLVTCQRLFNLNLDYSNGGFMSVNFHGRIIGVRVSHIGIDENFIQHIMNKSAYKKEVEKFKVEFRQIDEAARKSSLQSQGNWSRSSANMMSQPTNRLAQNNVRRGGNNDISGNISTSQSSNSLRTLIKSESQESNQNQQTFDKPIVITSIDTFTPLSGFITKLRGYQKFLQQYPNYRNKTVLIQFIPSSYCNSDISQNTENTDWNKYLTDVIGIFKDLENEIKKITEEIHREFGNHVLILQEGNPPLAKRLAIWSQSQILLIATLKDGLCLPPLEFVTVKKILNDFQNSSLILSEYSGCSNAFSGFHSFNSFDLKDLMHALDNALSTPNSKKAEMMQRAYTYSSRRNFQKWVESFLKDLKQMYNPTQTVAARYIYLGLRAENLSSKGNEKVISTALDIEQCATKFGKCHRCLILIDHEALPRKQFGRGEMQPTDQTIEDLAVITQDSRNTVAIISTESRNYVQKQFNRVPNLWLAAESGYEYRINGRWQTLFKISSKSWLKILKQIMQEYCDNVDGSFVEERNCTIVWNYKNAEEEHGPLCAKELYLQIVQLIGPNAPIEIVQGNGFLEVKPVQLKKTQLLSIFLTELSADTDSKIDFLLYIGADTSDEPVFKYLKGQTQTRESKFFSTHCLSNLCILGKKPSKADFFVDEIEKLAILINKIGIETKKRKKSRSYSNLNEVTSPVHVKTGLQSAGLSTNDMPVKKSAFGPKNQVPVTIDEREASEEESNMNFAESIRSPMSGSFDPNSKHSINSQKPIEKSQSQNFTFATEVRESRVFSQTEEVLSASNSYKRDFCDNLSPQGRQGERLGAHGDRPIHDSSMPLLRPNKDQIVYDIQLNQVAVAQQINKVMKEEIKQKK